MRNRWGNSGETVSDFILGGSKIAADSDCSHEIKRHLLLGKKVMTTIRYHFTPVRMSVIQKSTSNKCWKKREPSYTVGGNANYYTTTTTMPLWRIVWRVLKKLEIELPYDPAIPLLGIHTEETRIERDTCTPMFIAALFIIART